MTRESRPSAMHAELQADADEVLACQAQAGSLSTFEELVYRYEARIYRFVRNSCRNESDAKEVTQDTFVSAYRNIGQFDLSRSFATWLFAIARHKGIDRHRANRVVIGEQTAELLDEDDPSVVSERRDAGEDLWQLARQTLPELQFQSLWLRYAEDMSVRDIARVLHRTQTHVKVLLFRGRTTLGREWTKREAGARGGIRAEPSAGAKSLKNQTPGAVAGLARLAVHL